MIFAKSSRISSRRVILFLSDMLCISLSILGASILRLSLVDGLEYVSDQWGWLAMAAVIYVLVLFAAGMYERDTLTGNRTVFGLSFVSVVLSLCVIISLYYIADLSVVGRGILLMSSFFIFLGFGSVRYIYKLGVGRGFLARNTLIVGEDPEVQDVIDLLKKHDFFDYKVFGIVSVADNHPGEFMHGYPVLGFIDKLKELSAVYDIECLIMATSRETEKGLLKHLRPIRYSGIHIMDYVGLKEEIAQEIDIDHIDDEWLMHAAMNSSRIHIRKVKRIMDFTVSLIGVILSSPILLLAAIAIKLDTRGPVFFRQKRMGCNGHPYELMKLRTMKRDAEKQSGAVWAKAQDARITRVGNYLRKWRIDEIPQLFNVLKGEMSLVGPRPERPEFLKTLSESIPFYEERLFVPPGVTGWAQIKFPYASSIDATRRKLQYELYYIKHMSLSFDLSILLRTAKTVLIGVQYSEQESS